VREIVFLPLRSVTHLVCSTRDDVPGMASLSDSLGVRADSRADKQGAFDYDKDNSNALLNRGEFAFVPTTLADFFKQLAAR
jgi:hypothetical protein